MKKIKKDEFAVKSDFGIEYNIPEDLKNKKFTFRESKIADRLGTAEYLDEEHEFTLDEIHQLLPLQNSSSIHTCIVFWDDVAQFTTLGFQDVFKRLVEDGYRESKGLEIEKEYDFCAREFFNRGSSLLDGIKYLEVIYKIYPYNLLYRFYKKFYHQILEASPMSGIIPSLCTSNHMMSRLVLVFRFKVTESFKTALRNDIREYFDNSRIEVIVLSLEEVKEAQIYQQYQPSAVFTPDGAKTLGTLVNSGIENVDIYTHVSHNGFTNEFMIQYVNVFEMSIAPGKNRIYFFDDQIHVANPEAFDEIAEAHKEIEDYDI